MSLLDDLTSDIGKAAPKAAAKAASKPKAIEELTADIGSVVVPTSYEKGADFGALVKEGFVDDPMMKARIFAEQRFPDMPVEQSLQKYKVFDEGGEQAIAYTKGEKDAQGQLIYYREKPENISSELLNMASAIPSEGVKLGAEALGAAAAAARVAPNPVARVLGSATGAAIGGGATEAAFQAGQALYGDDFDLQPISERAKWAAFGEVFGGVLEPAVSKAFKYMTGSKGMPFDEDILNVNVDDVLSFAKERGIDLTPAELTNATQLKQIQRVLKQDPITASELDEFLKLRTDKINDDVFKLVNDVSGVEGAQEGVDVASKKLIDRFENLKSERSDAVGDLYQEGAKVQVAIAPIKKIVDPLNKIAQQSGTKRSFLNKYIDLFFEETPDGKRYLNTKAGNLHDIRQEIDRVLELDTTKGWHKRELSNLRKQLDGVLKEIPEYKKADKIFAEKSKPITAILDRFGAKNLSDVESLGDVVVKRVFSSPKRIAEAKKIFLDAGEREAWDNLAGSWIMGRLENMPERVQGVNTAFDIKKALLGAKNKKQGERLLNAAFDEDQRKNITSFIDVMEVISRDGNLGSPTWTNGVVSETIKEMGSEGAGNQAMHVLDRFASAFSAMNVFKWPDKIENASSANAYEANMKKLADLFTRPDGLQSIKTEMELIKKYGAKSGKGKKAVASMLARLYGSEQEKERQQASSKAEDVNKMIGAEMMSL